MYGNSFFCRLMTRGSRRPGRSGLTMSSGRTLTSPWRSQASVPPLLVADPGGLFPGLEIFDQLIVGSQRLEHARPGLAHAVAARALVRVGVQPIGRKVDDTPMMHRHQGVQMGL